MLRAFVAELQLQINSGRRFNHPTPQFAKSGPQNSIHRTTFGASAFGFLTAARRKISVPKGIELKAHGFVFELEPAPE